MAKYKITVEEILEKEGEKYPETPTIYEQTYETDDNNWEILENIIKAVNQI